MTWIPTSKHLDGFPARTTPTAHASWCYCDECVERRAKEERWREAGLKTRGDLDPTGPKLTGITAAVAEIERAWGPAAQHVEVGVADAAPYSPRMRLLAMLQPGLTLKPNDTIDYADRAIGLVRWAKSANDCECGVCRTARNLFDACEGSD